MIFPLYSHGPLLLLHVNSLLLALLFPLNLRNVSKKSTCLNNYISVQEYTDSLTKLQLEYSELEKELQRVTQELESIIRLITLSDLVFVDFKEVMMTYDFILVYHCMIFFYVYTDI